MTRVSRQKSNSGKTLLVVVLLLGLVGVATGGWLLWERVSNGAAGQRLARMPEIDQDRLSERARKLVVSCQESVRLDPNDASAWGLLGRAYQAHQFQAEARQCFEIAAELEPDNSEWYYSQALTMIPTENQRAIELIRQAIERGDDNLDQLRCRLAELLFEEAEFADARQVVDKVLQQLSDHARANMLLARLLLIDNQVAEALKAAQIVIDAQPQRKEALQLISQIHSRLGNSREASQFAARAEGSQAFNPAWPDEIQEKILSLRKDVNQLVVNALRMPPSMIREKLEILEEAVSEEPHEPQWHVFLGQTLLQVRDFARATEVMEQAAELHPESAVVHYTLGLVLLNAGQAGQAIPVLEKTVALKPDYSSAYRDLGIAYRLENQLDQAIAAFRKSLEILPGNFKTQLNLAVTLETAGQIDDAIAAYHICLELGEQPAEVSLLLGKLYAQQQDNESARKFLEQALELDSSLTEARTVLNSLQ